MCLELEVLHDVFELRCCMMCFMFHLYFSNMLQSKSTMKHILRP